MYSILQFNAISCHSPVSRQPAVCIQYKPAGRAGQQFVLFDSTQPGDQKTCRASKCNIVQLIFHIEIKLLDKQLKLSNSYLNWKRCLYLSVCTYLKILLIAGPIWFSLIINIIIGLGKGYLRCCGEWGGSQSEHTNFQILYIQYLYISCLQFFKSLKIKDQKALLPRLVYFP